MVKVDIHPHMFIADFVKKYQDQIKPLLEEGDMEAANVGILDVHFRACQAFEDCGISDWKNGTYERYESAIKILKVLSENKISSKKLLDSTLLMINRDVAELEFILQGDKIYEEYMGGQR